MNALRIVRRYFSTTDKRAHIQIHSEDQLIKRKIQLSSNHIISIIKDDISAEKVDAIVNPSFASLKHHEGISSDIVAKGGKQIQEQCNEILRFTGKLSRGQVASTSAGSLPSKYIFHASSPVYDGNANPEASMALVVKNCLQKATTINCHSISMPLLVKFFDYPKEEATEYMIKAVLDWCENNHNTQPLDIRFVNFEDNIVNEFVERLDRNLNTDNNIVS